MESLKILFFNWRCWKNPAMGGAEVFTHELAKGLVIAGHNVTLFTSAFPGCRNEEVSDGITIVRSGGKYSVYGKARKMYKKRFIKEHFDIVVDEINTVPFFTPAFVKNGEKLIALIHQLAREYWFYETDFPINYLGYYLFEDYWLKKYHNIPTLTVSESSKNDLEKLGFKKIQILREGLNFTPIDSISPKSKDPTIIYSGRLKSAKRPDHLLKAFSAVKEKHPQAKLLIVGDGILRENLEKNKLAGVKFLGALNNVQRRDAIKKAWVLVNPSVREGFGLNIIESNALGTPCIAYNVAGLRDSIIDQETGLLSEAGNISELTKKINHIIENESIRNRLSETALVYSRSFSWTNTTEDFLKVIELH